MDLIHTNLRVADVDRSVDFYTERLGFEHTSGFENEGTVHEYVAAENGIELQLTEEPDGPDEIDHGDGFRHVAVLVEDVDATFEDVDNHGVVEEPADHPVLDVRTAFVLDPDGYTLELVQRL